MVYGLKKMKSVFQRIFHIHNCNIYVGPFLVCDGGQIKSGTIMMCKCGKEKNYRKKEYNHHKQFYFDIETNSQLN